MFVIYSTDKSDDAEKDILSNTEAAPGDNVLPIYDEDYADNLSSHDYFVFNMLDPDLEKSTGSGPDIMAYSDAVNEIAANWEEKMYPIYRCKKQFHDAIDQENQYF